jgi:hypothetical protein
MRAAAPAGNPAAPLGAGSGAARPDGRHAMPACTRQAGGGTPLRTGGAVRHPSGPPARGAGSLVADKTAAARIAAQPWFAALSWPLPAGLGRVVGLTLRGDWRPTPGWQPVGFSLATHHYCIVRQRARWSRCVCARPFSRNAHSTVAE